MTEPTALAYLLVGLAVLSIALYLQQRKGDS